MGARRWRVRLVLVALRAQLCMHAVRALHGNRQRADAGRGDDYMAAMDLPRSESESGSDAEAPGTSHNPNRPSRRAAPGPWAGQHGPGADGQ